MDASTQAGAAQQASAAMVEISANIRQGTESVAQTEEIAIEAAQRAIDALNAEEIADLVAYLMSRGDSNAKFFKK